MGWRSQGKMNNRNWREVTLLLLLLLIAGFYHTALLLIRKVKYNSSSSPAAYKIIIAHQVRRSHHHHHHEIVTSPAPPHQRFSKLLQLESTAQKNPQLGPCYKGNLLFPDNDDNTICEDLDCLWSVSAGKNIDFIDGNLLSPRTATHKQCPLPRGGQTGGSGKPTVSFIITMHNHVYITSQCIIELFRTSQEVDSAELIVIDDGSDDDSSVVVNILQNLNTLFDLKVTYHRNEKPLGYGPANSKGIELASGKYIALINNDAFVLRGWLSSLLWTVRHLPNVGMVGPLFVNEAGIIQEAGGVIYQSGFTSKCVLIQQTTLPIIV